ncbi:MAG: hypothetical protein KUG79_17905 [Pseudomonadales bacterium]|nr:hypothetical protein [Pseudomonadales bacterium]
MHESGRKITGALWLPEPGKADSTAEPTLVCFGHGASGDRFQTPICSLAYRFTVEAGLPVLSLDGPVHGLRQKGEGGRAALYPELQRQDSVRDMIEDWHVAVACVQARKEVGQGKLAYFGLSMGSIYGIPFLGTRTDVIVAAIGLLGAAENFPHSAAVIAAAKKISCPLVFFMQLEDELFEREHCLHLFDQLASVDKRLHANPGLHPEIPDEEIDYAFQFMRGHIAGTIKRRVVGLLAE